MSVSPLLEEDQWVFTALCSIVIGPFVAAGFSVGCLKFLQRIAPFKLEGGLRAVSFQVLSMRLCSIFMRKSVEW